MSLRAANSGARAALCVERLRRSIAFSFALHQIYLPDLVLLRFNSRKVWIDSTHFDFESTK